MSNVKEINFIGIGAAKSGSSWLNNILLQHPDISIPARKELTYFNRLDISEIENKTHNNSLAYYLQFWDWGLQNKTRGEFSPQYLGDDVAPIKIKECFPNCKLIVILRNPIHRALSHLEYDQYFNAIIPKNTTVENAFKKHPYLLTSGLYAKHLERWFSIFPKQQIKIIIFENAIESPTKTSKDLFEFLELSTPKNINFSAINERKEIKYPAIAQLLKIPGRLDKKLIKIKGWNTLKQSNLYHSLVDVKTYLVDKNAKKREKSKFDNAIYQKLNEYYKAPNLALEKLLEIELNHWK